MGAKRKREEKKEKEEGIVMKKTYQVAKPKQKTRMRIEKTKPINKRTIFVLFPISCC